eukprot:1839677-Pyramimonas_sp.AAC.1
MGPPPNQRSGRWVHASNAASGNSSFSAKGRGRGLEQDLARDSRQPGSTSSGKSSSYNPQLACLCKKVPGDWSHR